jgi:hypothetical protein
LLEHDHDESLWRGRLDLHFTIRRGLAGVGHRGSGWSQNRYGNCVSLVSIGSYWLP